jgi:hypothetical protein
MKGTGSLGSPPPGILVRTALGLHRLLDRLARCVLTPEALVFNEIIGLARSEVIALRA